MERLAAGAEAIAIEKIAQRAFAAAAATVAPRPVADRIQRPSFP